MPSIEVIPPVENILPYLFITAVFEALAVYLFQFRKIPGALFLVYCQLCKGIWIFAKAFCGFSQDLTVKLFWAKFTEWMPILLVYYWFEFIIEVSQQEGKLLTILRYGVRTIAAALLLIVGFDYWLGWYWGPISLQNQVLQIVFGPAATITMAFCYFLNLISLGLSIRWVYCTYGLRRQQAVVLAVTPVFNLVGNYFGYIMESQIVPPQVLGLLLSAFYVTWVFYRWRIYSILPLAQDAVTQNMNDGLLVVDKKSYIVDLNPAAKAIFSGISAHIGDKFKTSFASWPALSDVIDLSDADTIELEREVAGELRTYQVSMLILTTPQGDMLGKTLQFKDISEQKRNQAKMIDQQKALSIMRERERLGRELHDGQGQIWSYIHMQVEAARSMLGKNDTVQADALLEKLAGVTRDMHVDLRESITGLQLASTKEGIWQTLAEYLLWYKQNYGIEAELFLGVEIDSGLFAPTTEVQMLRIIQEALTNVRKYAKARAVKVIANVSDNLAQICVEDDGSGFDIAACSKKKGSFGLKIMQERAEEIGAILRVQSNPGEGTKVLLQVPLEKK